MKRGKYKRDGEKGISALQKKILECLEGDSIHLSIPCIAIIVYKTGPVCQAEAESERVTIHKSLHSLKRRGLVNATSKDSDGRLLWTKVREEETR